MNNKHSGNQYRLSRKHLVAASFITLAGLLILPRAGKTQTVLTTKQAEEKAETLLGKRPDHVDSCFSKQENSRYFAFTLVPESKWKPAQEDIWFYERPSGSNEMRELCQEIVLFWAEAQRSMVKGVANNGRPRGRSPTLAKVSEAIHQVRSPIWICHVAGPNIPVLATSRRLRTPRDSAWRHQKTWAVLLRQPEVILARLRARVRLVGTNRSGG
jgi:hypothetical protein